MRALLASVSLLALSLTGCAVTETAENESDATAGPSSFTMPEVSGEKLDVAYEKIKDAGFDDKDAVKIDGGGALGVVVESNWTVCSQTPAAGADGTDAPELTIDRSCDDESSPSDAPSETPSTTPTPEVPSVITAKNSPYFKQILNVDDYCDPVIGKFAQQYSGVTIAFDGSVAAAGGGNFLVSPGDGGEMSVTGPSFQFSDASGDPLSVNDLVRITATVGEFNQDQCLLRINDVAAQGR